MTAFTQSELDETVYQLGGTYALNDRVSLFAGLNTGFNANGGIAADRSRTGERFDPEFYEQYEVGVKTGSFYGVTGTFALFELTRENILVTDPLDAAFLVQTGEETTQGFEAELAWSPNEAIEMRGGYAYIDAEITSDTNPANVGKTRPRAPQNQINALASYTFIDGPLRNLRLTGSVAYIDEAFASLTNTVVQPSYTLANVSASYTLGKLRLDAILSNAFDETYFITRNDVQVNAGEPSLFTVRAAVTF